ncbi:hypothetical protein ACFL96_16425 [Thermoproteota archaeon]
MNNKFGLKELEKRSYLSYYKDGLIDLFIAVFIIFFGFGLMFIREYWYILFGGMGGVIAVIPSILTSLKQKITVPRIGHVDFSVGRKNKINNNMIALTALAVLSALSGLFTFIVSTEGIPSWFVFALDNSSLTFGLLGASLFGFIGYMYQIRRFFFYGLGILIILPSSYFMQTPFHFHIILLGFIILLSGVTYLSRFLREYPKPSTDDLETLSEKK